MTSESNNVIRLDFKPLQSCEAVKGTKDRGGSVAVFPAVKRQPELRAGSSSRTVVVCDRKPTLKAVLEHAVFELENIMAQIKKETDGGSRTIPRMKALLSTLRSGVADLRG